MKKLLNTLYVTSEDCYARLDNQTVIISRTNEDIGRFPLHTLESIVLFSHKGASPALMGECAKRSINLSFMDMNGRFLARIAGERDGNVLLRRTQYRVADDKNRSCDIAKGFVIGKIYNQRWVVERTIRDHGLRVDKDKLSAISADLKEYLLSIEKVTDIDTLRGIEGKAAVQYFSAMDDMILNQKSDFEFVERSKRPPMNNLNALLSFGYSILTNDCVSALESVGLDSYVGFMHTDRPGRNSLALDLMEEFRAYMVDRVVISMVNLKVINKSHFRKMESNAVYLNEEGRKLFLSHYQKKKQEKIMHPFLQETVQWGLLPYIQAMLLARYLRGDLDDYPPFMWK